MPDPFRLKVLNALTELLQSVTPANGYESDLSNAVFRGRAEYGDGHPLPMVSILEPPLPADGIATQADNATDNGPWMLLIQGFVEDDVDNPADPAYRLEAEVKAVIGRHITARSQDRNFLGYGRPRKGNVVDSIKIGRGAVRPPDSVSNKACFWLYLTINLTERLDKPYD